LIEEILLELLGSYFSFYFFGVQLRDKIRGKFIKIIAKLIIPGKLLLQCLELDIEISLSLHIAGADDIKLLFEQKDLSDVLSRRFICENAADQKSAYDERNNKVFHHKKKR